MIVNVSTINVSRLKKRPANSGNNFIEGNVIFMNDKKPENIVSMASYKTHMNKLNTDSLELLNECRDLMTDRLSHGLSVMLNMADDILFDLVQKSGPSEHHYYFNAMREVRLKRTSIEADFKENFSNLFSNSISMNINSDDSVSEKSADKEIDIEESIALNATVGKVRHDCHEALFTLDQRMCELLSSEKVEKRLNPVRPETVCTAFQKACQNIESGIEIKLILFKLFEKYVTSSLHTAYVDIDTLLCEKKISTETRPVSNTYMLTDAAGNPQNHTRHDAGITRDKNYFIVANRIIRNEITKHLGDTTMPVFIRDFLFNHWSKLLLKIYIKVGVDSQAWVHAVEVVDDLVNCIGKEISAKDKLNLEPVMPNLIQRLKFGMNVIPVSPVIREEFIAELKQYHHDLIDIARAARPSEKQPSCEDITVPSFRISRSKTPFTDELLVDNKNGDKTDFDME